MYELTRTQGGMERTLQLPLVSTYQSPLNRTQVAYETSFRRVEPSLYRKMQTTKRRNGDNFEHHFDSSAAMKVQREPQEFKESLTMPSSYVYNKYEVLDLTYSLVSSNLNFSFVMVLFVIEVCIRYFSIFCLCYLMIQSGFKSWEWIVILFITAFIYFVAIVKISIKAPETKSEYLLRESFNSLEENQNLEYFPVVNGRRLLRSILRGLVPPQFSFFYINDMRTSERKMHTYTMVNFIYNSIEATIYYPFFLIYTIFVIDKNEISNSGWSFAVAYLTIAASELIFISLCLYLLIFGCRKKGYLGPKSKPSQPADPPPLTSSFRAQ